MVVAEMDLGKGTSSEQKQRVRSSDRICGSRDESTTDECLHTFVLKAAARATHTSSYPNVHVLK